MTHRTWTALACGLALTASTRAYADAIPSRGGLRSDATFVGLASFPAYRFVVAPLLPREPPGSHLSNQDAPLPVEVREGEPVATHTPFALALYAVPRTGADLPTELSADGLRSAGLPSSGSFLHRPQEVSEGAPEQSIHHRWQVRRVHPTGIALEALASTVKMADGSERPWWRPIPVVHKLNAVKLLPGWKLFWAPDPAWPTDPADAASGPRAAGDDLPVPPGAFRTLVARPDSGAAPPAVWKKRFHGWEREMVPVDRLAVARRTPLDVSMDRPGALSVAQDKAYQDRAGRWFHDLDTTYLIEDEPPPSPTARPWWLWLLPATMLAAGIGALWRRRRKLSAIPRTSGPRRSS